MRIASTVLLVVALSALVGVFVARTMTTAATTTTTTTTASHEVEVPVRKPAGATLALPVVPALRAPPPAQNDPFLAARAAASSTWRQEITVALSACLPPPGARSVPVGVTFELTLNAPISTELLKRYVVERVSPPPGLAPNVEACLRRVIGTTVNVAAAGLQLPVEPTLREVVVFPLPAAG
ncbi:MAG: hypothetical protein Q8O67_00105 [Deltaproteobacteria bacterium]|nr:hypothetical protein [Deltaproteobacteria bacterium]